MPPLSELARDRAPQIVTPPPSGLPEPSAVRAKKAGEHALRSPADLVGQTIAERYRVERLLAMGGMGAVYLGRHLLLKKRVAIKILRPDSEGLPGLVTRFEREAIAGAHIVHPHVAAATDFGRLSDGSYFLVLEYVAGRTLHAVICQGRLPPVRAVHIARQLASALGAVHAMGIVHRDVKSANVMLLEGQDDFVKLIDFGFAKVPVQQVVASNAASAGDDADGPRSRRSMSDGGPASLTAVGLVVGTVEYMAPEAALGMRAVGPRADLYALGIIFYEMLTGRHPFDEREPGALFAQHRFTPPPLFSVAAPGASISPALETIVMRLLAKDPESRFASSDELIAALDALATTADGAERAAAASPRRVDGPGRGATAYARRPLAFALAASALALGFGALGHAPRATVAEHADTATIPAPAAPPAAASVVTDVQPVVPATIASVVDPTDLAARRDALTRALRGGDWARGEPALRALAALDPGAYHVPATIIPLADMTAALDREGRADAAFDALAHRLGADGVDVLYELVATRGLSRAALRAAAALREPEVLARATPSMRVAFELRSAPCADKLELLDRVARDGDERALLVLETQGPGCFAKSNRAVNQATIALRAKLAHGR